MSTTLRPAPHPDVAIHSSSLTVVVALIADLGVAVAKIVAAAMAASIVVFVDRAGFSLREGIDELMHPGEVASYAVVYLMLGVSLVLDSLSLFQSVRQLRNEASPAMSSRSWPLVHQVTGSSTNPPT